MMMSETIEIGLCPVVSFPLRVCNFQLIFQDSSVELSSSKGNGLEEAYFLDMEFVLHDLAGGLKTVSQPMTLF